MENNFLKHLKTIFEVVTVFSKIDGISVDSNFIIIDGQDYEVIKEGRNFFLKLGRKKTVLMEFLKEKNLLEKFDEHVEKPKNLQDDLEDLIGEKLIPDFKDPIKVGGEPIYYFNGKSYELSSVKKYNDISFKFLKKYQLPKKRELMSHVAHLVDYEVASEATEYDIANDPRTLKRVCLAFTNGTLTVYPDGSYAFEGIHRSSDRLFFNFNFDFKDEYLKKPASSIIIDWWDSKFMEKSHRDCAVACYADLFVTQADTQFMCFLYGTGGTGKSQLSSATTNFLSNRSVSNVNVEDLNKEFKTAQLFDSIVNFSSEVKRGTVDSDKFKAFIARDACTLSRKYQQDTTGAPLAKWFGFANAMPSIEIDSGVARRFGIIQILGTKIYPHLSPDEFKHEMRKDFHGFTYTIFEGLITCYKYKFDLRKMYSDLVGLDMLTEFATLNSPVEAFITEIIDKTDDGNDFISNEDMFMYFELFRRSRKGTAISTMKYQTFQQRLKQLGLEVDRSSPSQGYKRGYKCVKLKAELDADFNGLLQLELNNKITYK